jgi:hypothetical protein
LEELALQSFIPTRVSTYNYSRYWTWLEKEKQEETVIVALVAHQKNIRI